MFYCIFVYKQNANVQSPVMGVARLISCEFNLAPRQNLVPPCSH